MISGAAAVVRIVVEVGGVEGLAEAELVEVVLTMLPWDMPLTSVMPRLPDCEFCDHVETSESTTVYVPGPKTIFGVTSQ